MLACYHDSWNYGSLSFKASQNACLAICTKTMTRNQTRSHLMPQIKSSSPPLCFFSHVHFYASCKRIPFLVFLFHYRHTHTCSKLVTYTSSKLGERCPSTSLKYYLHFDFVTHLTWQPPMAFFINEYTIKKKKKKKTKLDFVSGRRRPRCAPTSGGAP